MAQKQVLGGVRPAGWSGGGGERSMGGRGSKKKQGSELRLTRVEIRRPKAGWGRSLGRSEAEPELVGGRSVVG